MSSEPETGEISADELAAVAKRAIRDDRTELFTQLDELLKPIAKALQDLPFKDAELPLKRCSEIMEVICDPIGEHVGSCYVCEEPVFLLGADDPDDDCESMEDGWAHRSCMDRLRKESPGMFRHVEDDEDGRPNEASDD
jgi:hypothetical protein